MSIGMYMNIYAYMYVYIPNLGAWHVGCWPALVFLPLACLFVIAFVLICFWTMNLKFGARVSHVIEMCVSGAKARGGGVDEDGEQRAANERESTHAHQH